MQKFKYYSDLHGVNPEEFEEDSKSTVCIIAGDWDEVKCSRRVKLVEEMAEAYQLVIDVFGNHEHYRGSINRSYDKFKESTEHIGNYVLLENEFIMVGDIKIIGSTLWSDIGPYHHLAKDLMNDYKYIRTGSDLRPYSRRITPNDTTYLHYKAVEYIKKELDNYSGDVIVVTHHAPSFHSVHTGFIGDAINVAYATELELPKWPNYWIHGHIHQAKSYLLNGCNVLCNPGGYHREITGFSNTFNYFYL